MAYYLKQPDGGVAVAASIHAPGYSLTSESRGSRDGWIWHDTPEQAYAALAQTGGLTKLTLMLRLAELGKWETFKEALSQMPEILQDAWALALEIRADDPLFAQAAPVLQAALKMSDAEFSGLMAQAKTGTVTLAPVETGDGETLPAE